MKKLISACVALLFLSASAQDNFSHVFLANQSRLPIIILPSLSGNVSSLQIGKVSFRAHEITHDHSSTISAGDFIGLPEKDHNEANSSLVCNRSSASGANTFTAELQVQHAGNILFTILVESRDSAASGFTKLYYNIKHSDGTLENVAPGLLLKDNTGTRAQVATEINYAGDAYRLVYGVFDEHQDNTDNIIFSISNKTDTVYRYEPLISDTLNPDVLNIVTYNTAFLMPLNISDQDENEKVKVFYKAVPKNMDIIVLEECFEPSKVDSVLKDLLPYYPYHTGKHNRILIPNIGKEGGVRILSKYPILEEGEISYSENGCIPDDFFSKFANKGVKYAKINKKGQIIHVFGTHTSQQPCDLYVMGRFMAGFNIPKEDIVIMAGDFNVDLNRYHTNSTQKVYPIMMDTLHALEPTFKSFLNDWEYKGTTSGLNHYYCCNPDGKQHLDYVLVSSLHRIPSVLSNRSLMGRLNEPDESFGIFDMSDHEPVYARIEFPALSRSTDQYVNCIGDPVTLSARLVNAMRGGRFQWYRDQDLLVGEQDSILNITLNSPADFTTYTCRYSYNYMPDTSINDFFDFTYMDYHWVFRGTTPAEISSVFTIVPADSSMDCYGLSTSLTPHSHVPFALYPNPAAQYIDINGSELLGYNFEIMDAQGRKMPFTISNFSENTVRMNIRSLAAGTYFIRGSKNDQIFVEPFIKH
ncbi:MAG: sphingomyelinase precursor [Bacteroidota bacterium]|nr:sphingomyelinase precursor [Bacteroidota bacterium]